MIHQNIQSLTASLSAAGITAGKPVEASVAAAARASLIDDLVWTAVFSDDAKTKDLARETIHDLAWAFGAIPSSILPFYEAIGRGEMTRPFTVPAHNIRTLAYDTCRALFRAAIQRKVGAFVFEIARSEIGYTEQRPAEYAACVLGAAIKEGFVGPVFIQGDHFQASAKKWFSAARDEEVQALEGLIEEAIAAEFYNIDIDTSTLVVLDRPTLQEQQRDNYEGTGYFTNFIREREPAGIEISIGGEIGEVGTQNTTPDEFRAYISGLLPILPEGMKGVSKVSIQTGTSHGGVPLPDGSVAQVKIDFDRIREITHLARSEYGIAGAVQHGASTLPEEVFDHFPKADAVEIHLATGFQNMVYDHPAFPPDLLAEVRRWCDENRASERKDGQTEEQFFYKTRKRALGTFKRRIWDLPDDIKGRITADLEAKFGFLFEKLGVPDTADLIAKHVPTSSVKRPARKTRSSADSMAFVNEGEGE